MDTEPKVVRRFRPVPETQYGDPASRILQVSCLLKASPLQPGSCVLDEGGRGNNWAFGYAGRHGQASLTSDNNIAHTIAPVMAGMALLWAMPFVRNTIRTNQSKEGWPCQLVLVQHQAFCT